ncbi:glycerol-3-phosphate 1-O-acyltransferase PlsY [Brevundimonas aveniformis]|uniref:glycerol-3-phosphate 1-O-acyltransferase PlsY n=1 Tax=Brevundimonas aveniformis TaxID=370977 RepID=UPI00041362C8|nr:glycerol-3-phosphate 1-O-acyltransferase PlsY [Brevundimonas aveniformis]
MADLAGVAVWTLLLVVVGAYLLGSIPFGLIVTRLGGAGDVRSIGSGNIGATNVLRTGRKELALATLVLDAGKGAAAVLLARCLFDNEAVTAIAGGAAFFGHLFPVWLAFKGGKGVATFFGVLLALAWPTGLIVAGVWIGVFALSRISSLSALVAAATAPFVGLALGLPGPSIILIAAMATLIFFRHQENIGRLIRGQEPRFGTSR